VPESSEAFNSIGPTALFTAYWRRLGGYTPYAHQIYDEALDIWQDKGLALPPFYPDKPNYGVTMEVRQRAIDILFEQTQATQVLGVADGLAPTGMIHSTWNPRMHCYTELDLPFVSNVKQRVVERLGITSLGGNYHIEGGSALDISAMEHAARHFDRKLSVYIGSFGTIHYFTNEQRAQMAESVRSILRTFGGAWITDLPHHLNAAAKAQATTFNQLGTGIDLAELAFDDRAQAVAFFEDLGFSVDAGRNEPLSYADD